jgi:xanthine/uracil permease
MAITRVYSVWVTGGVEFQLAGVALATVVGIILNLIFPASRGTIKEK